MVAHRVAIVGAGLSGLAAGLALRRQGVDVDVYEARETVGGCCATTQIGGFTFNDGAMFVAVPRLLDHAFARLGLDRAHEVPMQRIRAPQASFLASGTSVRFDADGVHLDGDDGAARNARLQQDIARMMARWTPLLRTFVDDLLPKPLSLSRVIGRAWRYLPQLRGTLAHELEHLFHDPEARAAMAAVTLYTGLRPERTPVFQIIGLVSMLEDGLWLPHGGMGAVPAALHRAFVAAGGRVHAGAPVEKLRVEGGRVRGLTVAGSAVDADAVVSTASGMATFAHLLDPADVPTAMRRRVERAPLSHRAVGIQLGLANALDVPAHVVNRIPLMDEQYRMQMPQPDGVQWLSYSVPTHTCPDLAPRGGSVVEMFAAVDPARPAHAWDEAAVAEVADAAIDALSRQFPLDIAVRRVRGPREFEQGLHLYDGALYGLSPAARPDQQFPHETPLPGLFLAGQTTSPGFGVATSLFSGVFAADALLKRLVGAR